MHYHKPKDVEWLPDAIAEKLSSQGLQASSDGGCVKVVLDSPSDDTCAGSLLRQMLPNSSGAFQIELAHRADKLIRNVIVNHDINLLYVHFPADIKSVLEQRGLTLVTHDAEFSIAREYCDDIAVIDAIEAEVLEFEQSKQLAVKEQNYVAAARYLDSQCKARDRLDELVRRSLGWKPGCPRDDAGHRLEA